MGISCLFQVSIYYSPSNCRSNLAPEITTLGCLQMHSLKVKLHSVLVKETAIYAIWTGYGGYVGFNHKK